jgi:hypothetical protein
VLQKITVEDQKPFKKYDVKLPITVSANYSLKTLEVRWNMHFIVA